MTIEFKFNIGDILALKGVPQPEQRWLVVERWMHECYGGVQLNYHCRLITESGATAPQTFAFTEPEMELSGPFIARSSLSRAMERLEKYAAKENDPPANPEAK